MKNILYILLLTFVVSSVSGQSKAEGTITYNRKVDWIEIMSKLPWLSSEEIDRNKLTWGKNRGDGTNYDLHFKGNKSIYTYKKDDESRHGYSWKKEALILVRDYKSGKTKDIREIAGKKYLLEDKIEKKRWKILNEIKEVAGFLCMKAQTRDTIKGQIIDAWFTDAIPFYGGPEGYGGLPGMILELNINDGGAVISATKVDLTSELDKLPIPKKMKGKKISYVDYNKKIKRFIEDSMEGRKNPFWRIRY